MATTNLGRVSIVPKGEWDNATQYKKLDIVTLEGNSYIAVLDNTNKAVTNTAYWQLVAEKGDKGDKGNTGNTGSTGPTGNGIASITKTGTSGLVDTYTITYTNGNTSTFTVTNGKDGEDGEVTQAQLDAVERKVDYYKNLENALVKETKTGTNITINDTANTPMSMSVAPSELEQYQMSGKNLLNIDDTNLVKHSESSTFTKSDNNISITLGNVVATGYYLIGPISDYVEKTLTFSLAENPNQTFAGCKFVNCDANGDNGSDIGGPGDRLGYYDTSFTLTIPDAVYSQTYLAIYLSVQGTSGETYLAKEPMVEKSSSATTFEPYVGGIPIPSVDVPSDVHSISGNNTIKVMNKNLWDEEWELGRLNYNTSSSSFGQNVSSSTQIRSKNYIQIVPNIAYYCTVGSTGNLFAFIYDENKTPIIWESSGYKTFSNTTLTFPSNARYIRFYLNDTYGTTYLNNVIISKGSTATTYTPHQEQSLSLNLGNLEYCKIGNYADEFYLATESDTSLVAGKWYLKKTIDKVVLDGSESGWSLQGTNEYDIVNFRNSITTYNGSTRNLSICDLFTPQTASFSNIKQEGYMLDTSKYLFIRLNTTRADTVDLFQNWLENNNVIFYYVLATPEYILLNDTLQTQLTDMYKFALSQEAQTNIVQQNDDLPFVITAEAIKDLNTLISNLTNAIIEVGGDV